MGDKKKIRDAKRAHGVMPKGGQRVEVPPVEKRAGYRNHNPKPARNGKNDELIILQRQEKTAECYLKGMSQMEVVVELARRGIATSQPTVSNDLKDIFERWEKNCVTDFDKARLKEIARIDQLEAFAWRELEWSMVKRTETPATDTEPPVVVETRKQASVQWHGQVIQCVDRRIKLLGLVRDVTVNNNAVNIIDPQFWQSMTEAPVEDDPIEAKIESVKMLKEKPGD